jgi:hypothetical protein
LGLKGLVVVVIVANLVVHVFVLGEKTSMSLQLNENTRYIDVFHSAITWYRSCTSAGLFGKLTLGS